MIRDAMLAASGELNRQMYGPSMYPAIPAAALSGSSDPDKIWPPFDAASRFEAHYLRLREAFVDRADARGPRLLRHGPIDGPPRDHQRADPGPDALERRLRQSSGATAWRSGWSATPALIPSLRSSERTSCRFAVCLVMPSVWPCLRSWSEKSVDGLSKAHRPAQPSRRLRRNMRRSCSFAELSSTQMNSFIRIRNRTMESSARRLIFTVQTPLGERVVLTRDRWRPNHAVQAPGIGGA